MSFLVVGEALVDVVHGPDGTIAHPGGSPTNVAVGLSRLGHDVRELCFLGDDVNGDLLRSHLRDAGVRLQPGALTAPATSVAEVRIDTAGDASYEFAVRWDVPTAIDWAPDGVPIRVVHTGSIALVLGPGAGHVLHLLRGRPEGVRVTIDPNVRPAFLPAGDAAARLEPFFALADLVKLSADDAALLYPGMSDDAVLDRLLELGPTIAALTRAAAGAIVASAAARVAVPAMATRVVDTIGAGDSFMAALVAAVAEADDWRPAPDALARFADVAARASAFTVSRAGADLPTCADLLGGAGHE